MIGTKNRAKIVEYCEEALATNKLVNKVEGSKDAGFLPGSDYTIVYTSPTFNLQMKENVSKYATFSTEK